MNQKIIKFITHYSNTLFTYNNICSENPVCGTKQYLWRKRHYIVMANKINYLSTGMVTK